MENEDINVIARGLVHTGKKRSQPSIFVWDCKICNDWNTHRTKILRGEYRVLCKSCRTGHLLNKTDVKKEVTGTNKTGSIFDLFY